MNWNQIATQITEITGIQFQVKEHRSITGGCINQGVMITDGQRRFFIKLNQRKYLDMFVSEAAGLQQLIETQTISLPHPICWGIAGERSYLVLEWIDFGSGEPTVWREMGRKLARLHQWVPKLMDGKSPHQPFGWHRNNTIGLTPQLNPWTRDWSNFWIHSRIDYQLQMAQQRGGYFPKAEQLLTLIPTLLRGHYPRPSLVHGDLWTGNWGIRCTGEPVIFDPAPYWGDREVDLAMTELFGRFPEPFYQGYDELFPMEKGYESRKVLYNLYHVLNHFNLFGGSYESQVNTMISQLIGC